MNKKFTHCFWALVGVSALVVTLIWLPFGLNLGGVLEEWDALSLFAQKGVFFWAGADSPLSSQRIRPLTALPHAIAFVLDPDSFKYWNVLLAISLIIKAASASAIAWWLIGSRRWAVFAGVLLVLYPADTMQLSFRALHINWSLALILLAGALQLYAYTAKKSVTEFVLALAATLSMVAAILMYEAALLLALMPYVVMVVRYGWKGVMRELLAKRASTIVWLSGALACVAYIGYVASHGDTYQEGVTGGLHAVLAGVFHRLPLLFSVALLRALVGGWYDATRMAFEEYQSYTYLIIAWLIILASIFVFGNKVKDDAGGHNSKKVEYSIIRMLLAGIGLLLLGYLPYLTSGAHVNISQRTYLFASPGAVLVCLSILLALERVNKRLVWLLVAPSVFIGLSAQLYQFHHYERIFAIQSGLLRQIMENLPDLRADQHLIILDESQQLNHTWMLRDNLHNALTYLYGKRMNPVEICLEPGGQWQKLDPFARTGTCRKQADNWVFDMAPPVSGPGLEETKPYASIEIPNDEAVVLKINRNGTITPTAETRELKAQLSSLDDVKGRRYRGVLEPKHWLFNFKMFKDQEPQSSYRWDFGRWWSMEVPPQGEGWREAEWRLGYFHHVSTAWKVSQRASLMFELAPVSAQYQLQAKFTDFASEAVKKALKLQINGHTLPYGWTQTGELVASVPQSWVKTGFNELVFISPQDAEYYGLSMALDWFSIKPE